MRLDDQFKVVVAEPDREENDADDQQLTGATLDRASKAALAKTGGGTVTGSERHRPARYEIEVTKADGSQVDVSLDDQFKVVSAEPDHED